MTLASEVILRSREVRREAANAIDHTQRLQEAAHESVNEHIIKKIAQTVTLTVSAQIATLVQWIPPPKVFYVLCKKYNSTTPNVSEFPLQRK